MICYIGLGSNLADPAHQIRQAVIALHRLPATRLIQCSSLYGSTPVGPADQPDFINAVAAIDTDLPALDLLHAMQVLEQQTGRVRTRHWGERTLDLDLLLYGDQQITLPELQVPHPRLAERAFVLGPLHEIAAPLLTLPDGRSVTSLWQQCNQQGIWYHDAAPVVGETAQ